MADTKSKSPFFIDFFYLMRENRMPVTITEWMTFTKALMLGLHEHTLDGFYELARMVLVKSETHYDQFDLIFRHYFEGLELPPLPQIRDEILDWLNHPAVQAMLPEDVLQNMEKYSLEELFEMLEERLKEQKGRHNGGNYWIGTGGASPFGHGGAGGVPGIRIGGPGGARSAIHVASMRRFRNYRSDIVLDTRQIKMALRKLRILTREGHEEELDLEGTIDETCRNAGELEFVWQKSRKNTIKLLLLMDTGGSMSPFTHLCNRLFSAAHQSDHFKDFKHYLFHNCIYGRLYNDYWKGDYVEAGKILKQCDSSYRVILVGDACMAPYELWHPWYAKDGKNGYDWFVEIKHHFDHVVWLNPEPERYWAHETIEAIGDLFPMYPLTLDGLEKATKKLVVKK